jgi:hypothetical protein
MLFQIIPSGQFLSTGNDLQAEHSIVTTGRGKIKGA